MKRLLRTPRGTAELDVAGGGEYVFVTVTVFGDDGWATDEDMWGSGQDEGLAAFLARVTGMPPPEADATADEFLATWRERGGPADDAVGARFLVKWVAGALVAVAVVASLLTWVVVSVVT